MQSVVKIELFDFEIVTSTGIEINPSLLVEIVLRTKCELIGETSAVAVCDIFRIDYGRELEIAFVVSASYAAQHFVLNNVPGDLAYVVFLLADRSQCVWGNRRSEKLQVNVSLGTVERNGTDFA